MKKNYGYLFFLLCSCVAVAGIVASYLAVHYLGSPKKESPPAPTARIVWTDCHSLLYSERDVDCGRYYPAGDSGRFFLPFAIFRYAAPNVDAAPLVYIAGGPGDGMQTHVDALQAWAYWTEETALERDLVIFDQRGLKPGEPYWDCEAYNALNREILPQNLSVQQEYELTSDVLTDCLERFDQWLRGPAAGVDEGVKSFSTLTAAANLNEMLELIGYNSWHLWGVSYGSRLALVAAQQKPGRASSLLLDSPYPLDQGKASDKPALYAQALKRFWTLCSNNAAFCGRDVADAEALFWRVLRQLDAEPVQYEVTVPGSSVDTTMVLNGQRLFSLTLFALYDQRFYAELLEALVVLDDPAVTPSAELGPVQLLLNSFVASALDTDFNTMIFYAIECNDNLLQPEELHEQALEAHSRLREFLFLDAAYNPCKLPVFNPEDLLHTEPVPDVPTLILAGELDPVTPVAWGESLAQSLPQAELVVAPRIGHAVLSSGVCEPSFFNDYLASPHEGRNAVKRHCF